MNKIVYILGAGFSAPYGLPVMRDFLLRAKDLYFRDTTKYAHFEKVLETIDKMHKAKTYYEVDLLNIEEVLSILDMEDHVSGGERAKNFSQFIADVIIAYSPPPPVFGLNSTDDKRAYVGVGDRTGNIIFRDESWKRFGFFVANLMNLRLRFEPYSLDRQSAYKLYWESQPSPRARYSVITLNYDRLFEMVAECIMNAAEPALDNSSPIALLRLAKLHGSVDGEIVAPTWKKWTGKSLQKAWSQAYVDLCDATEIRILGYSLPPSDAYVRYLLEASILKSKHLKKIDVVCLDDSAGTLEAHFRAFIHYKFMRFRNLDLKTYSSPDDAWFQLYTHSAVQSPRGVCWCFDYTNFESWHERFMAQ